MKFREISNKIPIENRCFVLGAVGSIVVVFISKLRREGKGRQGKARLKETYFRIDLTVPSYRE